MTRFVVPPDLDGERVDKVVAALGGVSRATARRLAEQGMVTAGGVVVGAALRLAVGSELDFEVPAPRPALEPEPVPFEVRYEDEVVAVVDKPAGVVVHPGAGRRRGTLAAGLLERYPELEGVGEEGRWGLVHRLDRETSGLLVVARTPRAHARLTADLARRRIGRRYLALAEGLFEVDRGTIEAPIGADPRHPARRAVTPDGRPARTHYTRRTEWPEARVSLLDVALETGRTHQIRVHLAAIDHPVVGDRVYGRPGRVDSPRPFLHAARLELDHPSTGRRIEVESPLPPDLAAVLASLDGPP